MQYQAEVTSTQVQSAGQPADERQGRRHTGGSVIGTQLRLSQSSFVAQGDPSGASPWTWTQEPLRHTSPGSQSSLVVHSGTGSQSPVMVLQAYPAGQSASLRQSVLQRPLSVSHHDPSGQSLSEASSDDDVTFTIEEHLPPPNGNGNGQS